MMDVRTGLGYDVHSFGEGDHIWLAGIRIDHTHGMTAHSDGDVALHALTDALLGAIADGDIGDHFPPSQADWKDARSDQFVKFAAGRVRDQGFQISNVDITVVAEAPKIGPHRNEMRNVMSQMLNIDITRVSIKATTSEQMGFVGRAEGIAAMATATIIRT